MKLLCEFTQKIKKKNNISKYFSNINVSDVTDNKSVWKSK